MHGAKHCSVAAGGADIGYVLHELVLVDLAQDTLAEIFGDALHLLAHGGILIRKVGMASAGVYDAKGISAGGKIKIELLDNGICRVGKVDLNERADRACHLVEQTAGLAEELVLRRLSYLRDFNIAHLAVIKQMVKNSSEQDFKRRRGRKARAGEHIRRCRRIECADIISARLELGAHAADKCL